MLMGGSVAVSAQGAILIRGQAARLVACRLPYTRVRNQVSNRRSQTIIRSSGHSYTFRDEYATVIRFSFGKIHQYIPKF